MAVHRAVIQGDPRKNSSSKPCFRAMPYGATKTQPKHNAIRSGQQPALVTVKRRRPLPPSGTHLVVGCLTSSAADFQSVTRGLNVLRFGSYTARTQNTQCAPGTIDYATPWLAASVPTVPPSSALLPTTADCACRYSTTP